jgi:hypothetical protein
MAQSAVVRSGPPSQGLAAGLSRGWAALLQRLATGQGKAGPRGRSCCVGNPKECSEPGFVESLDVEGERAV